MNLSEGSRGIHDNFKGGNGMYAIQFHRPQFHRRVGKLSPAAIMTLSCCFGGIGVGTAAPKAAAVDEAKIIANAKSGKDWPTNALDYAATRFSRLKKIDSGNVAKLGLAWS